MNFYAVSNLDIKMTYIANENKSSKEWLRKLFAQTKFFADSRVKKYNFFLHNEEVRQEAYLGLWEAVITYDYQKNFDFYRWAQWNISKKIRDYRINNRRFKRAKSSIKQELGSYDFNRNLCDQEVRLEMNYLCKELVFDDEKLLSKKEKDIIINNIFLGKKLKEIASDYNLSIERVRQVRNNGLEKIRAILA